MALTRVNTTHPVAAAEVATLAKPSPAGAGSTNSGYKSQSYLIHFTPLERNSLAMAVTIRLSKLLAIQIARNGTPVLCILLENSSTIWRLLSVTASKSPSNSMKLKYYAWVLIGHKCARFFLTFFRVSRSKVS
jgi:hypothetical protein